MSKKSIGKVLSAINPLNVLRVMNKLVNFAWPVQPAIDEAYEIIDDCFGRHDLPNEEDLGPLIDVYKEKAPDLQDKEGDLTLAKDGYPVIGRILPLELGIGYDSPAKPLILAMWAPVYLLSHWLSLLGFDMTSVGVVLAYFFFLFRAEGMLFTFMTMSSLAFCYWTGGIATYLDQSIHSTSLEAVAKAMLYLPAFFPLIYSSSFMSRHARRLAEAGTASAGTGLNPFRFHKNEARLTQAANAIEDDSALIPLGTATGSLTARGDAYAPDQGLPFLMSFNDLSTHFLITGRTGTGKTTELRNIGIGCLDEEKRRIAAGIDKMIGMFIADGKGSVAYDFELVLDAIIDPKHTEFFNPIEGLPSDTFANTVQEVVAPSEKANGSGQFFNSMAKTVAYNSHVLFSAIVKAGRSDGSLASLMDILFAYGKPCDADGNHKISAMLNPKGDTTGTLASVFTDGSLLSDSFNAFLEFQDNAEETRNNIMATVHSWFDGFMQSEKLRKWVYSAKSDIDFDLILKGKKYGVVLPPTEYGVPGTIMTALLKNRLIIGIDKRGSNPNWEAEGGTDVVAIIDEAQVVADKMDADILPKARSLKYKAVYATQNDDSFVVKFGEAGSRAFIASFVSRLSYKSTVLTLTSMVQQVGEAKIRITSCQSETVAMAETNKLIGLSTYNDLANPYRSWIKGHTRKHYYMRDMFGKNAVGAKNLLNDSAGNVLALSHLHQSVVRLEFSQQQEPIIHSGIIQKLDTPFHALAIINRAGVPRRDVIKTNPLDSKFNQIETSPVAKLDALKKKYLKAA